MHQVYQTNPRHLVEPSAASKKTRRALYIFCSPEDSDKLSLEREVAEIRATGLLKSEGDLLVQATWEAVQAAVHTVRYDIIHFAGHGWTYGLAFQDASTGLKRVVPPGAMCDLLGGMDGLKAVILNACYTENIAEQLTSAGVPFCTYWKGKVHDDVVPTFSRFMYLALQHTHMSFSQAFYIARSQLKTAGFELANPDDYFVGFSPKREPLFTQMAHGVPGFFVKDNSKPSPSKPGTKECNHHSPTSSSRHTLPSSAERSRKAEARATQKAAFVVPPPCKGPGLREYAGGSLCPELPGFSLPSRRGKE
ncbi:hypothetical protein CYMTET_4573 [Cymbomonas tetramitiformis]|uniref:CHAT domain-containing protein n=1 Tax=Cymbomonas tetramitiformis TaxID=36881 RepID=A0AAE0H148_9CHLO|nr:hypothetical protein CYMTET_4573 [Cymbomonas tetramitiformis]